MWAEKANQLVLGSKAFGVSLLSEGHYMEIPHLRTVQLDFSAYTRITTRCNPTGLPRPDSHI